MFGRRTRQPAYRQHPQVQPGVAPAFPPAAARQPQKVSAFSAARRLRHRSRRGLRAWLILAVLLMLGLPAHLARREMAIVVCLWLPGALWWWNRNRTRHSHGKQEQPPPLRDDQLLTDLRTHVCGPGGRLAGAGVAELARTEGGRRFRLSLVRGRQTTDTVLGAAREIASAAGISRDRVVVEGMPGTAPGERGPEHEAMVTILGERHPQHEIQEFTGPTLDPVTGLFDVGPYPDGQMAQARLYKVDEHGTPIRAASGIAAGTTGSGKSAYASRKTLEHLASGMFQVFLLDGQGGASLAALNQHAGWAALHPSEWPICLQAVLRLGIMRTRLIASRGLGHWDLELGPFVQVLIEEAHRILAVPANLLAVKTGIQEMEKAGIGFDISTQFPSQVELGASSGAAGANVLRDLAASGNVTLFRTGGEFARSVLVGAVEVSPRDLPQRPGMCHPLGVSMRTAPVRAIRAADPAAWAARFRPMPFSDLDTAALDGTTSAYSMRLERLAAHTAEPEAASLDLEDLDAEVAMITGEATPGQPAPGERARKTTVASAVWDVICEHGQIKRAALITEVRARVGDCHESSVDQALAAFERTRHIRSGDGHGMWEKTPLSVISGTGG